jgi:hypothetical protein
MLACMSDGIRRRPVVTALVGLGFVVLFAVFLGACLWLLFAVRSPRRQHPACGHCGYDLTSSTSNRCPECGLLFIEAGVQVGTSQGRSRARTTAGIVVLVIGLLFMPCLGTFFAARMRSQAVAQAVAAQRLAAAAAAAQQYQATQTLQATEAARQARQATPQP